MPEERSATPEITALLGSSNAVGSAPQLLALVYEQLHTLARLRMAQERPGHTLSATALVHEAYLRLLGERECGWEGRAQFYAAAAEAMRRILVEHARARGRVKRGGTRRKSLEEIGDVADLAAADDPGRILALEEAIRRIGDIDARAGEIVRLRFYAGLSIEQTASALGLSPRTVRREWTFARAWLYRRLERAESSGDSDADRLGESEGDPG